MSTPKQKERYQRMLQAALKEFSQKGYQEVSVDVVAKRALVSKATLYHHFQNKEDLFLSVFDFTLHQLEHTLHDSSFSKISDPFEKIKTGIKAFMKEVLENSEYNFFFKAFSKNANLINNSLRQKMAERFFSSGLVFAKQNMQKAQKDGILKSHLNIDILFHGMFGMIVHVLAYLEENKKAFSINTCAEQIAEIISRGAFA